MGRCLLLPLPLPPLAVPGSGHCPQEAPTHAARPVFPPLAALKPSASQTLLPLPLLLLGARLAMFHGVTAIYLRFR